MNLKSAISFIDLSIRLISALYPFSHDNVSNVRQFIIYYSRDIIFAALSNKLRFNVKKLITRNVKIIYIYF